MAINGGTLAIPDAGFAFLMAAGFHFLLFALSLSRYSDCQATHFFMHYSI